MGIFGSVKRREPSLVERLCHSTGQWAVIETELDTYKVRSVRRPSIAYIEVRHGDSDTSMIFQLFFRLRFSLSNPPSGLFAKLLLRNHELYYSAWVVNIVQNCEAGLQLAARLPYPGVTPSLFHFICNEMAEESEAFDKELASKFSYGLDGVLPPDRIGEHGIGVRVGQNRPDVRFIEPVRHHQLEPGVRRLPDSRGR